MRRTTQRGFDVYDEFTDSYDASVRVQQSSSAMAPHCWVFVDENKPDDRPLVCGEKHRNHGSIHLTIEQAQRLRDALGDFLADANR